VSVPQQFSLIGRHISAEIMGGGLKTLQRLAAVSSLSEFCRVAEKKSLMDELILVQVGSMISFLQRQDFTTVLTAALVRGLELLVSSSVGSGASTSTSANTSRATAHAKQHQSGGTPARAATLAAAPSSSASTSLH
jgi:hypothetical protein